MKKLLAFGALFLFIIAWFISCSKEKSFETGIIPGQESIGSLKDDSDRCMPVTPHGVFYGGVVPTDSNYVDVNVNVTQKGTYVIYTDMQNGISFKDSGVFTKLGMNTVHLKATGIPEAGVAPFTLNYDTSICAFQLVIQDSTGSGQGGAQFAFGDCTNDTVYGRYVAGKALNSTNKMSVVVDVTTPGSFNISTNTANGFAFSKSGTFTTTGTQTIYLDGVGTPAAAGDFDYQFTNGSGGCGITITTTDAINGNDSAWSFTEGAHNYHGYIDSAVVADSINFKVLWIFGSTAATGDTAFVLGYSFIPNPASPNDPPTGSFNTNSTTSSNYFGLIDKTTGGNIIYAAIKETTTVNVKIDATSFNSGTRLLTGDFAGTAMSTTLATFNISTGKFKATVK